MQENANDAPVASVLVRTRNDAQYIGRTLAAILEQETDFPFEVVVCDDGSVDGTREIAEKFPVRFVERPAGPYMPGRTLNALVRAARGRIAVFNNADAVPEDRRWLAALAAPVLQAKGAPVFAFARQDPRPDARSLVAKDSARAFGDGAEHAKWRFFFSLASSAAPRAMLLETPFSETIRYSEDVEWTWRNSRRPENPVRIAYCPDARVEHSHNYTLRELARRFRGEGAADAAIFGDRPSLARAVASAARETLRDFAWLAARPRAWGEIPSAPMRRLVQRIAHWRGLKDAARAAAAAGGGGAAEAPCARPGATLLYVESASARGGIEIFAERRAEMLRAQGRDAAIIHTVPRDFSPYPQIEVHKCTCISDIEKFPPEKTVFYVHDHDPICPRRYAYTPFRRNCRRPGGLWPCLFCAPLCGRPFAALGAVLAQRRLKRALARFKRLAVISEFMKTRLAENGFAPDRISVETPPPPCTALSPDFKPPEPVDILFAGQLIRGKGVQLLLQAMARMERARTLDVVGSGNMETALKKMAADLGVAGRVRWRGWRENPRDWMAAARCVAVPSFWQEPYGLVAAEAAALGKKIVAFDIGGLREACGGKAVLVPPGDIDALARALDAC